jgi:hypothetical protein
MPGAEEDLQQCRRELVRLLNENAALRYAAMSFGDLAERLNSIVRFHLLCIGLFPEAQHTPDDLATSILDNPSGDISSLHRSDVPSSTERRRMSKPTDAGC